MPTISGCQEQGFEIKLCRQAGIYFQASHRLSQVKLYLSAWGP